MLYFSRMSLFDIAQAFGENTDQAALTLRLLTDMAPDQDLALGGRKQTTCRTLQPGRLHSAYGSPIGAV
jgi:hypothetical protein